MSKTNALNAESIRILQGAADARDAVSEKQGDYLTIAEEAQQDAYVAGLTSIEREIRDAEALATFLADALIDAVETSGGSFNQVEDALPEAFERIEGWAEARRSEFDAQQAVEDAEDAADRTAEALETEVMVATVDLTADEWSAALTNLITRLETHRSAL